MLVVFLGYKILILVFSGSQPEVCVEMKFWYFLRSAHFPYHVKMKSFQKIFSELGKNCSSNCEQVVQLNDFLPMFLSSMSFCKRMRNSAFLCCSNNLGIFRGLKSKSGYFLGFSRTNSRLAYLLLFH